MIPCCLALGPLPTHRISSDFHVFSSNFIDISIFCTHTHHTWFPPPTWAAIALQPRLAHPPPISWPCATTTTPPQSTLSQFFHGKPCQTGTHSKIFIFLCIGPAPTPPTHSVSHLG